jgi:multidrug efflux pump subunit AcrA (membrane-fusion protein)
MAPPAGRQAGVDRFDEPIVVTHTYAWLGLAACLALAVGVIVWSAVATVAQTVETRGVVLVNGSIVGVQSPAAGEVRSIVVQRGQLVNDHEVVGTVVDAHGRTHPLRAAVRGTVLDVSNAAGASVSPNDVVLSLEQTLGPVRVRAFLPPEKAQQVRPGTRAVISAPEAGSFRGRVESIGRVPLDPAEVAGSLGSDALASLLIARSGVIPIVVRPSERLPQLTDTGDIVSVSFLVGSKHPIDAVL